MTVRNELPLALLMGAGQFKRECSDESSICVSHEAIFEVCLRQLIS